MPSGDFARIEDISADDADECGSGADRGADGARVVEGLVRGEWCGIYRGLGEGACWEGEGWRVWRRELRERWFEFLKGRKDRGGRGR